MKKLSWVALFIFFTGCAGLQNPYNEFYQDRTGGINITKSPMVILPTGEPKIYSGGNPEADAQKMYEDGYSLLGFSSFHAGGVSKQKLLDQAAKVKADTVIFESKYTNTISGVMPLVLPNNQTISTNSSGMANTSGNINGYGGSASWNGSGNYFGNSTTTVYGTQTTYIPYSRDMYDYFASYWIKMKKFVFGVWPYDLTSEQREKIGTNKGAFVKYVVNDSPAFKADIFEGDIITKINDKDVWGAKDIGTLQNYYGGERITVTIIRNDKTLIKEVQLTFGPEIQDEKYGSIPLGNRKFHSDDPQFNKTAKLDNRKIFNNYKKSIDAGLKYEQLTTDQMSSSQVIEIFNEIIKSIQDYGIKNQYKAIYSVRLPNVNEAEDLTDTIISVLNGK